MLADLSIRDYLANTASGDPVPGGGSSAALNAALAAALTEMVAQLTIAEKASSLRQKLVQDIDRDSASYTLVLKAFQMPKATEVEKAGRARAVQEAFKQAALVPLGVARDAVALMDLGRTVVSKGNPNAGSDGAAGVLAARMAARTAVYNVKINLGSIRDEKFVSELSSEADRLESEAERKEREILGLLKI
jgi:formiminotetrahydrofolate cyclodeaminase